MTRLPFTKTLKGIKRGFWDGGTTPRPRWPSSPCWPRKGSQCAADSNISWQVLRFVLFISVPIWGSRVTKPPHAPPGFVTFLAIMFGWLHLMGGNGLKWLKRSIWGRVWAHMWNVLCILEYVWYLCRYRLIMCRLFDRLSIFFSAIVGITKMPNICQDWK